MGATTNIGWCHATANLWHGCTKVHAGCDHCYAETLSHRWGRKIWGNDKPRLIIESVWKLFAKLQKEAAAGEMRRVFVGSMMDIFEKPMPLIGSNGEKTWDANDGSEFYTDTLRDRYFDEVVPATPNLIHLMLTKRPSNILKYIPEEWKINPPENVMYGTSPCDQSTADNLIPHLLNVPGRHFLSVEPMLGAVSLPDTPGIDWVICGGESGPGKRPMQLGWARLLRDQCHGYNIPFFMKQIDKVQQIPEDLMIRQFPPLKIAV